MPQPTEFHGRLKGRRAIVTGAGSLGAGVGTGKAIAALYAAEGARVALFDLDAERAEETRRLIESLGGEARAFAGNVADSESAARMCQEALDWLGGLDVLVNNIGISGAGGRLHEVAPEDLDRVWAVNMQTAYNMCRACLPALLAGDGKAIVNIASIAGLRASGNAAYGPSKAAMMSLTAEIAVAYGRDGIRANCIAPGHIVTPMVADHVKGEMRRVRREIAPIGIEGDAWDIAQAALFLAGPESRFITGVTLPVDGGATAIMGMAAYSMTAPQ